MTTERAPAAATTEKALRERIHRLFCGDVPAAPPSVPPPFWVGPTDEQKSAVSMDVEERVVVREKFEIQTEPSARAGFQDAQSVEQRWLNAPHVDLDGRSPEAMLTGGEPARRCLCAFVAAIEAAIQQGSFS